MDDACMVMIAGSLPVIVLAASLLFPWHLCEQFRRPFPSRSIEKGT
jgi:hypothetical protein